MSQVVFLIGMPGAGKTFWGRLWAGAYDWHYIDLDGQIESNTGKKIATIFQEEGEKSFREIEQSVLAKAIAAAQSDTIISCGGGTPVFFNNLELMKSKGCVVFLKADIQSLMLNLEKEKLIRPLLIGNATEKLQALLSERGHIYEQADIICEVKSLTETTFAEILSVCTNRHS